eukprot:CAMPEP_0172535250 /NCGR_PEP_ID=MMETSP1067-20121228/7347_1 /TAXON_ID=265564 ORGANISM="Thalassiosira punctigera, Strain Tpunct2005C2" /NCGR_SAMPLE_ID=MMETSP1067 /ASSEMBLY_ACC=CAM_ASM_000444 /LENGTH=139 /DNA_ID=CAMNT_0013320171 /DNA_START=502 /DNA_END=918 /DNA_ORIENTATION=+
MKLVKQNTAPSRLSSTEYTKEVAPWLSGNWIVSTRRPFFTGAVTVTCSKYPGCISVGMRRANGVGRSGGLDWAIISRASSDAISSGPKGSVRGAVPWLCRRFCAVHFQYLRLFCNLPIPGVPAPSSLGWDDEASVVPFA